MADDSRPGGYGGSGAHFHRPPLSYEEALEANRKFREEAAKLPANIMYEEMKVYRAAQKQQQRLIERGKPEAYGPPNPFALRKSFRPPMK